MKPHVLDESLWLKILTSKTVQGLAWKIEQAMQADAESRALIKMLVEKWAEIENVRCYFPDLADAFTPEAVFQIEYASEYSRLRRHRAYRKSSHVYQVLVHVSNLIARHNTPPDQLKRLYNNRVLRWGDAADVLPLFEISEIKDARLAANKSLYIPQALQVLQETKPKKKRSRAKTARTIAQQIDELEPRFSIGADGSLIIT